MKFDTLVFTFAQSLQPLFNKHDADCMCNCTQEHTFQVFSIVNKVNYGRANIGRTSELFIYAGIICFEEMGFIKEDGFGPKSLNLMALPDDPPTYVCAWRAVNPSLREGLFQPALLWIINHQQYKLYFYYKHFFMYSYLCVSSCCFRSFRLFL